jgi:hypothetical protein
VTLLVTLLAATSAFSYCACTILLVSKRWSACAGSRSLNVAAIAAFAVARIFPQSIVAPAVATLIFIAALLAIVRRSTHAVGAVLAAIPIAAMLLVVDRPFFPEPIATQFQDATIALLCVPGPLAISAAVISRRRGT